MYQLMRNVHLILGLVFALAISVYTVSSIRLAHRTWFTNGPTITEQTYSVDPTQTGTPRELGLYLIQKHALRAEIFQVQPPKGDQFQFRMRRIGTNFVVNYTRGATEAKVKTTHVNFMEMLTNMHFAHGLWHDDQTINLWGVILFLTSISLFLVGATGIYLWFKTYEERLIGSILLGIGLVFSLGLMIMVRVQG